MRKLFDALFRIPARRHRDEYQPPLNSQLIHSRAIWPAAAHGVRNYTGLLAMAAAIHRGDDAQVRIAVEKDGDYRASQIMQGRSQAAANAYTG
jgi:hypothetical protein